MNIQILKFTGMAILACPALAPLSYAQDDIPHTIIEQTAGDGNVAIITQQEAMTAVANISQAGTLNRGTILQVGPAEEVISATIAQTGDSHVANIEQSGVETSATGAITQTGVDNSADAVQAGVTEISFSIDQSGEANLTHVYQARMRGNADITQQGIRNEARVDQVDGIFDTQATIYQEGSQNVVEVLQDGETHGVVVSTQIGSDNYTWVHQRLELPPYEVTADLAVEGASNVTLVDQDGAASGRVEHRSSGDFNRFEYSQGGDGMYLSSSSLASDHNSDYILQRGSGTQINIDRTGSHNGDISIEQDGLGAHIRVEQTDSEMAHAEFYQQALGGHEATIRQVRVYDASGRIEQQMGANIATIEQTDTRSSSAVITQDIGRNLIASIYQSGGTDLSAAEIQQFNSENTALIEQIGVVSVDALIMQTGTLGYAEIRQTATNGGMNNSATITQAGEGYSASIHQDGVNQTATISQI